LGETKANLNDYEGMNIAFNKALQISDTYYERIRIDRYRFWANHINAAIPYIRGENESTLNYPKAVAEYQKAIAAWPDTSVTYRYIAIAYNGTGDIDNAIVNFKKAWDIGHDTASYALYGRFLLQRGLIKKEKFESDSLTRLYRTLIGISKGYSKGEVTGALGSPNSKKKVSKNSKQEDWVYSKHGATITLEGNQVVSKKVNMKLDSTMYKDAVKDFNVAIDVFELVKKADPSDNENLNRLLQAYVGADRINEAAKTFKLAVDNDPGNKTNRYVLGILYRAMQDYDGAILEFKEAIKIDPEYIDAIYDLGATYYNWGVKMTKDAQEKGSESTEYKKKFQESLPWMEKVSQMKEDDSKIWNSLGTIYAILGQKEKAKKAFDRMDELRKAGK
jgi:tetratricopeptide (TPR) repeat protein